MGPENKDNKRSFKNLSRSFLSYVVEHLNVFCSYLVCCRACGRVLMFDKFLRIHSADTEHVVASTRMKPGKCSSMLISLGSVLTNFANSVSCST